jgi:hypothetical protein
MAPDQSTLLWIQLQDVYFPPHPETPPCTGTASNTYHASPPAVVAPGGFDLALPFFHGQYVVHGEVDSPTALSGTAYKTSTYPITCPSQTITWTASAVAATPPAKFDKHYTGALGSGEMDVWTTGPTISAIQIDGLEESPCTDGGGPISLKAAFTPGIYIAGSYMGFTTSPIWGAVEVQASRTEISEMEATVTFAYAYTFPFCVLQWNGLLTGDTDGDGCIDLAEEQTAPGSQTTGGLRDPDDPNDYFNPSGDGLNRVDDILLVVQAYFDDDDDGNPGLPPYEPGYNPDLDRTLVGPLDWDLGPPNGLQRVDDILNQVKQYFHDCA